MLPFYPMYNMGYYHPVWCVPVNQSVPNVFAIFLSNRIEALKRNYLNFL